MNTLYKLHNISRINTSAAAKRKLYKHYNTALNHKGNIAFFTSKTGSYTKGYRCSYCHLTVQA